VFRKVKVNVGKLKKYKKLGAVCQNTEDTYKGFRKPPV